jgi:CRP-like cAMP-binding protein
MELGLESSCATCKKCPIGTYASTKWKAKISKRKYQNWYQKGQFIFYQGSPVHGMFLITSGKVKIVTKISEDRDQIVRLANDGHILGRQGKKRDTYANSAVTIETSQVCFIHNADVEELLLENPALARNLLAYYSGELRKAEKRIKILAQLTAREKVAETLLYVQSVFQTDDNGVINAPLLRNELAEISGTSTAQLIRELKILHKESVIDSSNKFLRIIDQNKLELIGNREHRDS